MAKITLRQLLDHAAERGYGVPAFNINNMEQGLAIMEAAKDCDAPVIIQASRGARSYAGDIMLAKMIDALVEMFPSIPVCLHQDRCRNPQSGRSHAHAPDADALQMQDLGRFQHEVLACQRHVRAGRKVRGESRQAGSGPRVVHPDEDVRFGSAGRRAEREGDRPGRCSGRYRHH